VEELSGVAGTGSYIASGVPTSTIIFNLMKIKVFKSGAQHKNSNL
jgi:hypothetical protein